MTPSHSLKRKRKPKRKPIAVPLLPDNCVLEILRWMFYGADEGVLRTLATLTALGSKELWRELPHALGNMHTIPVAELTRPMFMGLYRQCAQRRYNIKNATMSCCALEGASPESVLFRGLVLREDHCSMDDPTTITTYYMVIRVFASGKRAVAKRVSYVPSGCTSFSELKYREPHSVAFDEINLVAKHPLMAKEGVVCIEKVGHCHKNEARPRLRPVWDVVEMNGA